ncbi:MAG: translation initiation factor IF-2, partial [Prosthecobacter sp.]
MPGKSPSSKPAKPATDEPGDVTLEAESAKPKKSAGKKVLSLIEEGEEAKTKAPRKEAASMLPRIGAKPAKKEKPPEPEPAPAEPAKPTLDDQKKAALSLFDEKPKKRERPAATAAPVSALPPLSLLLDEPAKPKPVVAAAPPPPAAEAPQPEFEIGENGEKIIQLKPPIIVKDLAEKMGLKPFK